MPFFKKFSPLIVFLIVVQVSVILVSCDKNQVGVYSYVWTAPDETRVMSISGCVSTVVSVPITISGIVTTTGQGRIICDTTYPLTNRDTLNTLRPKNLPLPSSSQFFPVPTTTVTSSSVAYRDGTKSTVIVSTLTGRLMADVPSGLIKLLTQENKPLSSIATGDEINGWSVRELYALNRNSTTGQVDFINKKLTTSIKKAFSGVITYFPDGYYTFISNVDSTYNEFGWYQVSMQDETLLGIIYNISFSGPNFTDAPLNYTPNAQGYGIWGIDKSAYYPLFRLDPSYQAITKTVPLKYTK